MKTRRNMWILAGVLVAGLAWFLTDREAPTEGKDEPVSPLTLVETYLDAREVIRESGRRSREAGEEMMRRNQERWDKIHPEKVKLDELFREKPPSSASREEQERWLRTTAKQYQKLLDLLGEEATEHLGLSADTRQRLDRLAGDDDSP